MIRRLLIHSLGTRLLSWSAVVLLVSPAVAQSVSSPVRLQALVNDTTAQFQLAYRHHPAEQQRRHEELAAVLESWRTAVRSEANNQLLAAWLRAAMRRSMPGSPLDLPQPPEFDRPAAERLPSPPQPGENALPATVDKSVGDPFLDDPPADD